MNKATKTKRARNAAPIDRQPKPTPFLICFRGDDHKGNFIRRVRTVNVPNYDAAVKLAEKMAPQLASEFSRITLMQIVAR